MPTVSSLMSEDIVLIAWFFLAGESISDRGNIMSGVLHVVMLSWLPIEMMLVLAVWYTLIWVLSCSPWDDEGLQEKTQISVYPLV